MAGHILISACLLGLPVRYDGKGKPLSHPALERLKAEGRLVSICPEMSAGMPVPRAPAEIEPGATGDDVLEGRARVLDLAGLDVTADFLTAADNALRLAMERNCTAALLIDGSPSCGSLTLYDGHFSGTRKPGMGVTAAKLRRAGIKVYAPTEIEALIREVG